MRDSPIELFEIKLNHGVSKWSKIIKMRSPESKFSLHFPPRDARFACVSFDRGVEIAQILQVFDPPAEALEFGMKLADGGTVRLALLGGFIHMLLFLADRKAVARA
jgi:hypothetical protein